MRTVIFAINWVLSLLASILRLGAGRGAEIAPAGAPIPTLYEFEACPFCRIAREAVSAAGLPVQVRPCPKGGKRFRPMVKELGGKAQFPYLVDPETGTGMYESGDIARKLRGDFGSGRPLIHWLGPLNLISSQLGVLLRIGRGLLANPARQPAQLLEFHGSERHPAARLVKEHLCEMEIEYLWQPSPGTPRLIDPNTGDTLTGGPAILRHLKAQYAH